MDKRWRVSVQFLGKELLGNQDTNKKDCKWPTTLRALPRQQLQAQRGRAPNLGQAARTMTAKHVAGAAMDATSQGRRRHGDDRDQLNPPGELPDFRTVI